MINYVTGNTKGIVIKYYITSNPHIKNYNTQKRFRGFANSIPQRLFQISELHGGA